MDGCAETRDLLETAALERDGIERLEAGDTVAAARAAGHLAVCPPCAEELRRLRRTAGMLRAALAEGPSLALRERTLALVRAAGVERGPGLSAGVEAPSRRLAGPAWLAGLAAVLVMGAFGAGAMVGLQAGPAAGPTAAPEPALAQVAGSQVRIMSAPDALEVVLRDSAGTPRGVLATAPSTGQVMVLATGLDPAPQGSTYRCWAEIDGRRLALGTMYHSGGVAWWAGPVGMSAPIAPGTRFGVSLAGPGGTLAEPVLLGSY